MIDGLQGETVTVRPADYSGRDAYGNAVRAELDPLEVADVLVAPEDPASDIEDGRPSAARVVLALYVPAGTDVPWRGASVEVQGERYRVIGDPERYDPALVPTGRDLCVRVVRNEG